MRWLVVTTFIMKVPFTKIKLRYACLTLFLFHFGFWMVTDVSYFQSYKKNGLSYQTSTPKKCMFKVLNILVQWYFVVLSLTWKWRVRGPMAQCATSAHLVNNVMKRKWWRRSQCPGFMKLNITYSSLWRCLQAKLNNIKNKIFNVVHLHQKYHLLSLDQKVQNYLAMFLFMSYQNSNLIIII